MRNSDSPAMAVKVVASVAAKRQAEGVGQFLEDVMYTGLTKREHFAGLIMVQMLHNYHAGYRNDDYGYHKDWAIELGKEAFEAADGLLEAGELERTK